LATAVLPRRLTLHMHAYQSLGGVVEQGMDSNTLAPDTSRTTGEVDNGTRDTEETTAVMMLGSADEVPTMVTLVLRAWRTGPPHESAFRYEATHVQTGDVAYFRSLERAAQHIRCLVERVNSQAPARAPLQFPVEGSTDHGP